jgi:NAD-dependent SIR2 family protein deacetylase
LQWVESGPRRPGESTSALDALAELVAGRRRLFVLTGAGCSTASGIPDYRDREGVWKRGQPIRYQEFLRNPGARRRYWARSFVGWPQVAAARPNPAHHALAVLERAGFIHQLVTQNVDGLHQLAGQRRVLDLHGRLGSVDCLDCRLRLAREEMQERLAAANPLFAPRPAGFAPDGDAVIEQALETGFQVPACPGCGGLLKPAVVFFGENVPRPRVERAYARLAESAALLAVGTSLTVYSGYRFCREAAALGLPIVLLNFGRTRADDLAQVRVEADVGETLAALIGRLGVELDGGQKAATVSRHLEMSVA